VKSSSALTLKQATISEESMRDVTASGALFVLCACVVVATGIPAFLVAALWTALDVSHLLHIQATSAAIFGRVYLASVGCMLPLAIMLGFFKLTSMNLNRLAARLEVSREGVCWNADNPITRLTLRVASQPVKPVPWDQILAVTSGESPFQLVNEYNLPFDKDQASVQALAGRKGNINFVGLKRGMLRSLVTVNVSTLSAELRQELFAMITTHAAQAIVTKIASEDLIGASVEQRNLSYTDIWLNVLNSPAQRERLNDLVPGDRLREGDLTVISKLATGGQANLYKVQSKDGQSLVLKEYIISNVDAASAMNGMTEFETESSILESLSHPNIATMQGVFSEDGRVYIMLDFHEGQSLRQLVESDGALPAERVQSVAAELATALAYLHGLETAVIHRDISPDNVLILENGNVKLIDFSVARRGESKSVSDFVGKPSYVSPEQFRGFTSTNNDVYGFGATLYFALAGKDPEPITQLQAPDSIPDDHILSKLISSCTALEPPYMRFSEIQAQL